MEFKRSTSPPVVYRPSQVDSFFKCFRRKILLHGPQNQNKFMLLRLSSPPLTVTLLSNSVKVLLVRTVWCDPMDPSVVPVILRLLYAPFTPLPGNNTKGTFLVRSVSFVEILSIKFIKVVRDTISLPRINTSWTGTSLSPVHLSQDLTSSDYFPSSITAPES